MLNSREEWKKATAEQRLLDYLNSVPNILKDLQAGDEEAFDGFLRAAKPDIVALCERYIERYCPDLECDSVVSSVYARLWRWLNTREITVQEPKGLTKIVADICLSQVKNRASRSSRHRAIALPREIARDEQPHQPDIPRDVLERFMQTCSERDREILAMRLAGSNRAQIAEAIGKSLPRTHAIMQDIEKRIGDSAQ